MNIAINVPKIEVLQFKIVSVSYCMEENLLECIKKDKVLNNEDLCFPFKYVNDNTIIFYSMRGIYKYCLDSNKVLRIVDCPKPIVGSHFMKGDILYWTDGKNMYSYNGILNKGVHMEPWIPEPEADLSMIQCIEGDDEIGWLVKKQGGFNIFLFNLESKVSMLDSLSFKDVSFF